MAKKILFLICGLILVLIAIVFITNPLELLREARDQQRADDLASLKSAIDTYISNNAKAIASSNNLLCSSCNNPNVIFSFRKIAISGVETTAKESLYVNGNGWLPLDFSLNSQLNQTPIKLLPIDPLETGFNIRSKLPFFNKTEDYVYTFTAGKNSKYKLTAKMESKKGLEKAKNDGGPIPDRLEVGTDLTLKP